MLLLVSSLLAQLKYVKVGGKTDICVSRLPAQNSLSKVDGNSGNSVSSVSSIYKRVVPSGIAHLDYYSGKPNSLWRLFIG